MKGLRKNWVVFAATLVLTSLSGKAHATDNLECSTPSGFSFSRDERVQQVAEAYTLDAIDAARENFHVTLDYSDQSISQVEDILTQLYEQRAAANPTDDQIWTFAKMFGSYIGEVYRRNHGASWGMVTLEGNTFPGLEATNSCTRFWPWGKAHNRLINGPEDNVWHYYQALLEGGGAQ
jgi:hypothetical protein